MVVVGVISILLRKPAVILVWNNMIESFDDTVDLITHLAEVLIDCDFDGCRSDDGIGSDHLITNFEHHVIAVVSNTAVITELLVWSNDEIILGNKELASKSVDFFGTGRDMHRHNCVLLKTD
jgi:hypothetical protein